MVTFFRRRRKRVDVPKLRSRSDIPANVNRVSLGELTPEPLIYLGQAAYLQLTIFERLSQAVTTAPTTDAKEAVSRVVALSLTRHHGLVAEIERLGADSGSAMDPYRDRIDAYRERTQGKDWHETVVASYLTAGLLDDFYLRLADGLPNEVAARITALFSTDAGSGILLGQLSLAIAADPRLASRLAMWGRRLVGDTLLVARFALAIPQTTPADEDRLEPVFTELIAAHTRRMDALGLTA